MLKTNRAKILLGISLAGLLAALLFCMILTTFQLQRGTVGAPPPTPSALDTALQHMPLANIVFNTPERLELDQMQEIHLALGPSTPIEELEKLVQEAGKLQQAQIRISDRMEAHLSGMGFEIIPITPEIQAVSALETTEWRWSIKPRQSGQQRLHLVINVILNIDGENTPRTIRTFEKDIDVHVSMSKRVSGFVEGNWQWLWTAFLVPAAGWIWSRQKKKTSRVARAS